MALDEDLAIWLEQWRAERGMTFKEALNVTRPLPLGRRLISDIDNMGEALAAAEAETFR